VASEERAQPPDSVISEAAPAGDPAGAAELFIRSLPPLPGRRRETMRDRRLRAARLPPATLFSRLRRDAELDSTRAALRDGPLRIFAAVEGLFALSGG
jgi:hypothetical protein